MEGFEDSWQVFRQRTAKLPVPAKAERVERGWSREQRSRAKGTCLRISSLHSNDVADTSGQLLFPHETTPTVTGHLDVSDGRPNAEA